MSISHITPWFSMQDYGAIRQLCFQDQEMPSTFEEWENKTLNQLNHFEKSGVPIKKIDIHVEELAEYCRERGLKPDTFACSAFAIHKSCLMQEEAQH